MSSAPARLRRLAASLALSVYLAATQLAPLAHLATHRDDHTHGPALRPSASGRAFQDVTASRTVRGHARAFSLATALSGHGRPQWPWSAGDHVDTPLETPATAADPHTGRPAAAPPRSPHQHAPGTPAHTHDAAAASYPASRLPPPTDDQAPPASREHGTGSAAHFALATLDAPPAPALPVPEASRVEAPAPPRRRAGAVAPRQVLVRGPPALA